MISYAQNFEDVVLERVFHDVAIGRYIDLGGYDPVRDSVTKHFYDRGWSGVNVEPVARFHRAFQEQRPRDTNLNCACGSQIGTAEFHEWGDSGLSTYRETFDTEALAALGYARTTHTVPLTTLAEITRQMPPGEIDFLKIDVEGVERDVLLGADWQSCRPRVIVIEAIKPKLPGSDPYSFEPAWPDWEDILVEHGYEVALFDGINRFYYRGEEPALRTPLSYPANVTDGFMISPNHFLALPFAAG
jgi:FkbM family methyltransferase